MEKKSIVLIGAGSRGQEAYAPYVLAHPYQFEYAAVAEPIDARRERFAKTFQLPPERVFHNDKEVLAKPRMADAAMICTQDAQHFDMAMRALELGYTVMLEKPISPTAEQCKALLRQAEKYHSDVLVCHVLRYTDFFRTVKDILDSGEIGEVVSMNHQECVGYWHFAHSYVRGNWRNEKASSPMLLAKCCHDLDIIAWMLGAQAVKVSSYGSLRLFKQENAPEGAPARCTDGCPAQTECPFYAPATYLTSRTGWPTSVISEDTSYEARVKALKTGPYGRCVYHCDNDVVDHQVASMLFDNGVTVTFTVSAFTNANERVLHIMGTKGEIRASMDKDEIEVMHFSQGIHTSDHVLHRLCPAASGHGGGDAGIMRELYDMLSKPVTGPEHLRQSVHSHMIVFACEASRKSGETVEMKTFEN